MKSYKVIYFVGESIGLETLVEKGIILDENDNIFIVSKKERVALNTIHCLELFKLNGIGTMLKMECGSKTIFLAAYRLFLDIGTGFAITDYWGTLNIKKRLDIVRNGL